MATEKFPSILSATPEDVQLMLAAQCHIGTKNCDKSMEGYVWKRRADGEFFWWLLLFGFAIRGFGGLGFGTRGCGARGLEGSWRCDGSARDGDSGVEKGLGGFGNGKLDVGTLPEVCCYFGGAGRRSVLTRR
jgi:hypothetical protein